MKRLILAAGLALLLHALLFGLKVEWPKERNVSYGKAPLLMLSVDYKGKEDNSPPPSFNVSTGPEKAPRPHVKDLNKKAPEKKKNSTKRIKTRPKILKKSKVVHISKPKTIKSKAAFEAKPLLPSSPQTPVAKFYAYDDQPLKARSIQKANTGSSFRKKGQTGFLPGAPDIVRERGGILKAQKKERVVAAGLVTEVSPVYRKNPPPVYPRVARRRGYEGTVMLKVLVNRKGGVDELYMAKSSGYQVLDRAAMACVKEWVFEPARRGGKSVRMWVKVPIRFQLRSRQ